MTGLFACLAVVALPFVSEASLTFEVTTLSPEVEIGTEAVTARFPFENTGDTPVSIERVVTSCGCTSAEWPREAVAPGATGEVAATFTFGAREGHQVKQVTVETTEGTQQLRLEVTIPTIASVEPRLILWRQGQTAEPAVATVQLHDPASLRLGELTVPDGFSVAQAETAEGIRLTVTPPTVLEAAQTLPIDLPVVSKDSGERVSNLRLFLLIR